MTSHVKTLFALGRACGCCSHSDATQPMGREAVACPPGAGKHVRAFTAASFPWYRNAYCVVI